MNKIFLVTIISTLISACSGGDSPIANDSNNDIPINPTETQLFIGDKYGAGATYRVENFTQAFDDVQVTSMAVTETDAVPGSQIDIIWWTHAKDTDDNSISSYQYNAEVFISSDGLIDSADQKLFSLSCDAPVTTNDTNPCGDQGYVRCTYAESNNATLTCLTIPPVASDGFSDLVIDIPSYFSIGNPTQVSFITRLCLVPQMGDCIIQSSEMTLYQNNWPANLLNQTKFNIRFFL